MYINTLSIPSWHLIWNIPLFLTLIFPYFSNISPSSSNSSAKRYFNTRFFPVFNLLRAIFTRNHATWYSPSNSHTRTSMVRPCQAKQSTWDDCMQVLRSQSDDRILDIAWIAPRKTALKADRLRETMPENQLRKEFYVKRFSIQQLFF